MESDVRLVATFNRLKRLCIDLRKLGFSMRVEQSSVEDVKSRLNAASKRKWDPEITKKLDAVEGTA
jgi:hypothetical protein